MLDFFFVRTGTEYVRVNFNEVLFIKASKNYVQIVTEKRNYLSTGAIRNVGRLLPKSKFCRVQRSYIANIERIKKFDRETLYLAGKNVCEPDIIIPIGRIYINDLIKRLIIIPDPSKQKNKRTESVTRLTREAF
jgi:DNA-binding LytR/AlgR family response regulator